jgi:hypothetical protein
MLRTTPLSPGAEAKRDRCPACAGSPLSVFLELPAVPVHCNLLWPDRRAALAAPRGDIRLGFCRSCGLVYNTAFDPALVEYSQRYENSLHFSPHFQAYARALALRLIERFDLRGKRIVEIGAGDGDFLRLLCREGGNRGLGFDPGYDGPSPKDADGVTIIPEFYSEDHAAEPADFIVCRHVLEHIERPRDFLGSIRSTIGDRTDTAIYFEVPDFNYTLRDGGVWDVIYEHCTYFTAPSLSRLFAAAGFAVSGVESTFDGQFLGLEATPAPALQRPGDDTEVGRLAPLVASFAGVYRDKMNGWNEYLAGLHRGGRSAVVWGAGSKGVTFLNALPGAAAAIDRVVDINPRKQGMHVAGAGTLIVPPDALRDSPPDVVIVMNPAYSREVQGMTAGLGLAPELVPA